MLVRSKSHDGRRAELRPRVQKLAEDLRAAIVNGDVSVGDKLPSEAALTERYGVSRTVVREAIAALRSEGLVESRQGAGVFVIDSQGPFTVPFAEVDSEKLSSLVEMMEFRIAVEAEAAGLAAYRRSPAQEASIQEALDALNAAVAVGASTGRLDLEFHIAIARATNNPRFEQFLSMLGERAIPRSQIGRPEGVRSSAAYQAQLKAEHSEIAAAISARDQAGAREAMRRHLEGGLRRYQEMRKLSAKLV